MEPHEQYFKDASAKMRITGAGGIQLPKTDRSPDVVPPMPIDPMRRIKTSNGWVIMGGSNKRTADSPIKVLDMSAKIIDQRANDASKKNK